MGKKGKNSKVSKCSEATTAAVLQQSDNCPKQYAVLKEFSLEKLESRFIFIEATKNVKALEQLKIQLDKIDLISLYNEENIDTIWFLETTNLVSEQTAKEIIKLNFNNQCPNRKFDVLEYINCRLKKDNDSLELLERIEKTLNNNQLFDYLKEEDIEGVPRVSVCSYKSDDTQTEDLIFPNLL